MKFANNTRLWNFYVHGVTQSFINQFQTCRLQCKLNYIDGWTPKKEPVWFHFGKCVHYVLSRAYANPEPPKYALICEWINHFALANQSELQFDEDVQTLEQIYGFAEKVCYYYFEYYQEDFTHNWIYNESVFKEQYPTSDGSEKYTFLTGRFDGGFRTKEGHYNLLDTKCLSQINVNALERILPIDTQVMLYSTAATLLNNGETPKQLIYNIVRRPMNKMTKKDGSLQSFINRVAEEIAKKPEYYFIRLQIPISKQEINWWQTKFLHPVLRDIQSWYDNGCPSYYSAPGLENKYGLCHYFDLIVNNDQSKYFKRHHPFPELVD